MASSISLPPVAVGNTHLVPISSTAVQLVYFSVKCGLGRFLSQQTLSWHVKEMLVELEQWMKGRLEQDGPIPPKIEGGMEATGGFEGTSVLW